MRTRRRTRRWRRSGEEIARIFPRMSCLRVWPGSHADNFWNWLSRGWTGGSGILGPGSLEVIMNTTPGGRILFREIIRGLEKKYDHILIDCLPHWVIITQNAYGEWFCDHTHGRNYFAMKSRRYIISSACSEGSWAHRYILGLLRDKIQCGKKAGRGHQGEPDRDIGESVFETTIRNNVALGEAQYNARSIDYAPRQTGARDYRSLNEELLKRIRKMNKYS